MSHFADKLTACTWALYISTCIAKSLHDILLCYFLTQFCHVIPVLISNVTPLLQVHWIGTGWAVLPASNEALTLKPIQLLFYVRAKNLRQRKYADHLALSRDLGSQFNMQFPPLDFSRHQVSVLCRLAFH